jgi:hypothetical protein
VLAQGTDTSRESRTPHPPQAPDSPLSADPASFLGKLSPIVPNAADSGYDLIKREKTAKKVIFFNFCELERFLTCWRKGQTPRTKAALPIRRKHPIHPYTQILSVLGKLSSTVPNAVTSGYALIKREKARKFEFTSYFFCNGGGYRTFPAAKSQGT